MSLGNEEFDGAENESEEAHAEEKSFGAARSEESTERARSKRAWHMAGYATVTANYPEEEEEEENAEVNCKQPARNPVGGIHGREKESAARARSQRAGNLDGYATGITNKLEEYGEEENAAGNFKQLARNPVGGSHGWVNENALMSPPSMMGILRGAAGRFTKQVTTLPVEGNTPSAGKKYRNYTGC